MKNIRQILDIEYGGRWENIKSPNEFHLLYHTAKLEEYRDELYKYINEPNYLFDGLKPSCTLTKGSSVMKIPLKVYIDVVYQYLQDEIDKMYKEIE